jgi:hypothetical protein
MKSTSPEFTQLRERMEKIEQQNTRLKRGMFVLAGSLVVLMAMGAKVGIKDGHFRDITAGKISIIDTSGKELITIGKIEGAGTGIRMYNQAGKRILGLGLTADDSGSGMLVADNDGTPRFGLGIDKGVPSIAITNEEGKKVIGLGGNNKGYGLVIMDGNEVERAGIGFKEGNSGVALFNSEGEYVRGMVQRADGSHFASYADGKGNEIFTE